MKTKSLLLVALTFLMNANCLLAQQRTDYTTEYFYHLFTSKNVSSTYWNGFTWAFYNREFGGLDYNLFIMEDDGSIATTGWSTLVSVLPQEFNVSSCAYRTNLYAFYWYKNGDQPEIRYAKKTMESNWSFDLLQINETISEQMAAVSFNDTIYIFFVDEADKLVKYHTIAYSEEHSKLVLVSETPAIVNSENASIGNVAAITFANDSLQEQIMIAYPGPIIGRANNDIYVYTGIPGQFELYAQKPCANNFSAHGISMAQGSVKGGSTSSYNIQFGYTHANYNSGLEHCELNLDNKVFSDWESLDWGGSMPGIYTWFMEFYTKDTQIRHKYLVQGYQNQGSASGALWKSDNLQYKDQKSEVPPFSYASKFFDIVLVVEGAPPYALNGYKLGDDVFIGNPLSTFEFTKETENTVETTTTYTQSVEANMGVGPVTGGFKASFMESHGTSTTETVSITNRIIPPLSQLDSSGVMWYYYVAPTVVRSRWAMQDYNGNDIEPNRNLFFFNFHSPQMKTMTYDLSDPIYGDISPRANDLHTYESRGVPNLSGLQELYRYETDINIEAGGSGSLNLTFANTETDTHDESFEVSLGIEAEGEIFSGSAGVSAGFEYSRERTTTCSNSFYINWDIIAPKDKTDTSNIQKFSPIAYVMKTTDSTAYFLLDGLKKYKPYFVTYEVTDIEHGVFLESIGENQAVINKYKFSNYPNPCSDKSVFIYSLPNKSHVNLTIYNAYGQIVNIPLNETQNVGKHQYELSVIHLTAGIYYYRLLIGKDLITGKLIKK